MEKAKQKKIALWVLDTALNLAIIFGLVIVIQTWIIAPFDVYGSSMCDTLNQIDGQCQSALGEKIIINEALYLFNDPQRGDIVVFKSHDAEKEFFIKRVIGTPGDEVDVHDGKVYLKKVGETEYAELAEPYLNETNAGKTYVRISGINPFKVPEGKYLLMGDNRNSSTDSRTCFLGSFGEAQEKCTDNPDLPYVSKEDIRGKAWLVWWPLSNIRNLPNQYEESLAEK